MENYIFNKKNVITGLVIKGIAIISAIYGLSQTIGSQLAMTYFTNLSNILIALALIIFFIFDMIHLTSGKNLKKNYMFIIKFTLTLCISITWLIYMCILAPTSEDGFFLSYTHQHYGSLCLHFITPVLAIIDFIIIDINYSSKWHHCFYAIIPPLAYVVFVIGLATSGIRWDGTMYAPYNFLNYGAETGWFGFDLSLMSSKTLGIGVAYMIFVLVLIFFGIGRLFLTFNSLGKKVVLNKIESK